MFAGSDVPMTFGVRQVETVSTIGAGDNYNAGMIYALIRHGITRRDLTEHPGRYAGSALRATRRSSRQTAARIPATA